MHEPTFRPLEVGPVTLANRLALAPVKTALGGADGCITPSHISYYRRRAVGGAGLIIVEPMYVDARGKEHPRQLGIHTDDVIPGLCALVEAVHRNGAAAFAHLNHAGRAANPKAIAGVPEAPSSIVCPSTGATPEEMTCERVGDVLEAYRDAARRTTEAGFDGVELQLGLGYLPAQFLAARTNRRGDDYGGDDDRRWRFVHELVTSVRKVLGTSMAFSVRISGDEKVEGGLGLGDAIELARRVQAWGVDALHVVSGSACDSPPWYYQHMALPSGVNESLAAAVRKEISIPVLVAGRLGDPGRIRTVLDQGMADAVALGRPLLADPDLPKKMMLGREDDIMSCGSCLQGCLAEVKRGKPIGCIINPEVTLEGDAVPPVEAVGERLVVVGGGPAGMQAALSGWRFGYAVTLLERQQALGGLFALAPATPGKETMERPLHSMVRAVERSGIDIRTGFKATVDRIVKFEPDRVVVATGSHPVVPGIPGLDDPLTAEDVLTGRRQPGRTVLVLGGGMVGIEIAELLAAQDRSVVVVEILDDIARDMELVTRKMTLRRLQKLPITIHTSTRLVRLQSGEAFVVAEATGQESSLGLFESVIAAVGHHSYDPLSQALKDVGLPVTVIGDAAQPGQIQDATRSGFSAVIKNTDTQP